MGRMKNVVMRVFASRVVIATALICLLPLTGCVDTPGVQPRAALDPEEVQQAIGRLNGMWEGEIATGQSTKTWRWVFDGRSVAVTVDGASLLPRGWQPTLVEDQTIVLVVAHEAHLKESVLRFENADRFFVDVLPHVAFERIEHTGFPEEVSSP